MKVLEWETMEMEEGGGKVAGDSECISGGRVHV